MLFNFSDVERTACWPGRLWGSFFLWILQTTHLLSFFHETVPPQMVHWSTGVNEIPFFTYGLSKISLTLHEIELFYTTFDQPLSINVLTYSCVLIWFCYLCVDKFVVGWPLRNDFFYTPSFKHYTWLAPSPALLPMEHDPWPPHTSFNTAPKWYVMVHLFLYKHDTYWLFPYNHDAYCPLTLPPTNTIRCDSPYLPTNTIHSNPSPPTSTQTCFKVVHPFSPQTRGSSFLPSPAQTRYTVTHPTFPQIRYIMTQYPSLKTRFLVDNTVSPQNLSIVSQAFYNYTKREHRINIGS